MSKFCSNASFFVIVLLSGKLANGKNDITLIVQRSYASANVNGSLMHWTVRIVSYASSSGLLPCSGSSHAK